MSRDVLHAIVLGLHVGSGATALLAGPLALWHRRRVGAGGRGPDIYFAAVIAVALTAFGLVAFDPGRLWWLAPLALLTLALVLIGRSAEALRGSLRARAVAHGWGGSYIALVTASLVVSVSAGPVSWVLPTLVGTVLIERSARRGSTIGGSARRPGDAEVSC